MWKLTNPFKPASLIMQFLNSEKRSKSSPFVTTSLTDKKHAESLAKHFFEYYNIQNSNNLSPQDVKTILVDIYKSIGIDFEPTSADIASYTKILDSDGDGKVTLNDIVRLMNKYLVG